MQSSKNTLADLAKIVTVGHDNLLSVHLLRSLTRVQQRDLTSNVLVQLAKARQQNARATKILTLTLL